MHTHRRVFVGALAILLLTLAMSVSAAVPVHVVKTDLRPLIRASIQSRVQFAVSVPDSASTATSGTWTTEGDTATWRYAVQIPTAVSMSFHAIQSSLPESAVLVVRGAKTTTSYHGRDLHRGELWSRIHPGDALELTLTVADADRSKVALNITSLQAGYRSLGPGVRDHAYYRQLLSAQTGTSGGSSCVTNYACEVTANITPPGAATVALVVGNLYQCTGVLINDVPESNTPYVLTARHCQTGTLGGGNPGAASTVRVYWDAQTPCGATLGSIYDGTVQTQAGAQTVVEQQDAWLIKLDVSPVVSDAQFAGFDASGGAIQGGYTIHHAEGNDKQFTEWFGQAASVQESDVLGTTYVSNFWETVNQLGNVGPGASGSGLFNQNDRLVGLLTLGRQSSDPSGYESCPVPSPPAPNGTNGAADFTSLAAVWSSMADTTSSTGNSTLKSVLDPNGTGTVVAPSESAPAITFAPYTTDIFMVGTPAQIQWSAANATSCTAGGGTAGDGWAGTLPNVGSQTVVESSTGTVTYTLTCQFSAGRTGSASLSLQWAVQASVQISAPYVLWTTRPATVSWSSTVSPCALTGGGLSLSNLPASGSTTDTQATAGDVTYNVTCGTTTNKASSATLVHYVTPSLIFAANGTDRLLGQDFFLEWITEADSCVPSGGAPNDGWTTTALHWNGSAVTFSPKVTSAGTYTYTLTCSSGPISLQQSVIVTFENNAPYVNASLSPSAVAFSGSPADYSTLSWSSNLSNCEVSSSPNLPFEPNIDPPFDVNTPFGTMPLPQGTAIAAPYQSGTYVLTVTCSDATLNGIKVNSTPITLTVNPAPAPTASVSINPSSVLAGQSFTVSWTSANTLNCAQTGGMPNGAWRGTTLPPAGSVTQQQAQSGDFTFVLICQSIDPTQPPVTAQAELNIQALTATLSPATISVNTGNSFTLTWSSTAASSCTASGGGANGTGWSGAVNTSGTLTQTATTAGTYNYALACDAGNEQVNQVTTVTVTAPSSGSGSSSSGDTGSGSTGSHGGGGSMGLLELALLAIGNALRRRSSFARRLGLSGASFQACR
jgi:lysyl endopeptidase